MPVEIVTLAASEEYLANTEAIARLGVDLMIKQPGVIAPLYSAIQFEDKKTGYFFVNWETVEQHYALAQSPDYAQIMGYFGRVTSEPFSFVHVNFDGDHKLALSAPITEIAVMKLKSEDKKAAFFEVFDKLIAGLKGETTPVPHSITWGETIEHKGTYVLLIGWESVQAHIETASKEPYISIVGGLHAAADVTVKHAAFTSLNK